jgi:type I restriction enzyme S subunit
MKKLQSNNNNLPKGWRKVKLGEIVEFVKGKNPKQLFYKKPSDNFLEYILLGDQKIYVKPEDSLVRVLPTDIIIVADGASSGTIFTGKNGILGSTFLRIRIRPEYEKEINSRYLYFYLKYSENIFKSLLTGSAIPHVDQENLRIFEVLIPEDPNEQKRIADILSAFDEKIELNNKIIKTLEEMAQEVFKEWFVRFRFPGWQKVKFVDSELGKIPEGWGIIDLYDYISFEGGSQPPKSMHIYEKREGYIRFIQNRDYESDAHITYIPESKRNKLCNEYDIMMDKYGEAGKVRFGLAGAYNVALAKITPKPPLMREYLRWFLKQPEIEQMIEGSAVASTRASVNKIVFKNLKILLPPKDLMEKFEQIGKLYIDNYLRLRVENQTLTALRDLLLPKLMSGEIRI